MTKPPRKIIFALGSLCVTLAAVAAAMIYAAPTVSFQRSDADTLIAATTPQKPVVQHIATPSSVKAIYMTQCVVGTPSFRESLVQFIESSPQLNAVVIDIKDFSGGIAFHSDNPLLKDFISKKCGAYDMKEFVTTLHDKGIYVIGRITVFQDPMYAAAHPELAVQRKCADSTGSTGSPQAGSRTCGVWHDNKGLAFIDVSAKPFWDYIVELSKVSYEEFGFDELNYDYMRFPSDGPMDLAVYSHSDGTSKENRLEEFFQYLNSKLKTTGVVTSVDFFGYVTVHTDDLGIGQVLERALPYFDYICPMVYPSHYNSGFAGLKNVNSNPGLVVKTSMREAVRRIVSTTTVNYSFNATPIASTSPQLYEKPSYDASKMRPWLQAFDYPVPYSAEMIQAQITANEDAGLDSYLMWDAANKYTSLRELLVTE